MGWEGNSGWGKGLELGSKTPNKQAKYRFLWVGSENQETRGFLLPNAPLQFPYKWTVQWCQHIIYENIFVWTEAVLSTGCGPGHFWILKTRSLLQEFTGQLWDNPCVTQVPFTLDAAYKPLSAESTPPPTAIDLLCMAPHSVLIKS